jgi:aldehyde dehydrogenase (NAD+)
MALAAETKTLLETLGCAVDGGDLAVHSPIDGSRIGAVATATVDDINDAVEKSNAAFLMWRRVPAPRRGELVRLFGNALREQKYDLARLVTIDCGKPLSEGLWKQC